MVVIPLVLSAGVGAGVWLTVRALLPRPEPIPALLARLDRPGRPLIEPRRHIGWPAIGEQAAELAHQMLDRVGVAPRPGSMFELTGRSPQRHALDKVLLALVGFLAPLVPITEPPRMPRFGTSCEKPHRSTTLVSGLSPIRVPP